MNNSVLPNVLLNQLKMLANATSGKQHEYYQAMLDNAKCVRCVPLAQAVGRQRAVELIGRIRPEKKGCYKNATKLAEAMWGECLYCEGLMDVGGFGVDHAFNKIGGMYVDITAEYALGDDVSAIQYLTYGEYDMSVVNGVLTVTHCYGDIFRHQFYNSSKITEQVSESFDFWNGDDSDDEYDDALQAFYSMIELGQAVYCRSNGNGGYVLSFNAGQIWESAVGYCCIDSAHSIDGIPRFTPSYSMRFPVVHCGQDVDWPATTDADGRANMRIIQKASGNSRTLRWNDSIPDDSHMLMAPEAYCAGLSTCPEKVDRGMWYLPALDEIALAYELTKGLGCIDWEYHRLGAFGVHDPTFTSTYRRVGNFGVYNEMYCFDQKYFGNDTKRISPADAEHAMGYIRPFIAYDDLLRAFNKSRVDD